MDLLLIKYGHGEPINGDVPACQHIKETSSAYFPLFHSSPPGNRLQQFICTLDTQRGLPRILTDVSYVRLWMRCTGLDTKEVRTAKVFWWGVMPAHSHGHRM